MKRITDNEILYEELRMAYEFEKNGKILLVGNGESEDFWDKERYIIGNRWWKFWENKSDFEIIKQNP